MPVKWIKTSVKGIRYYEHPTRKHGVKKDRYFAIRYQSNGERKEEGVGWASDGCSIEKATNILAQLRLGAKEGAGPQRLIEKRAIENKRRIEERETREREKRNALTFEGFFNETYFPQAQTDKKQRTTDREQGLFSRWINPVIGSIPLKQVTPFHIEKIKKRMADAGQAPRSIEYALAIMRQVFNTAKRHGLYDGDSPTKVVKKPKVDNSRMRFLTRDEADQLLIALKEKSIDVHDMTLLSLHCGLRFGEIASLTWQDVAFDRDTLTIRDAKAGSRYAFMTPQVHQMLRDRHYGNLTDYVFQKVGGGKIDRISHTFFRSVEELGFNKGIDDPRLHVVFHTCRHTHASWLIEEGQDLYTVQRLLGHKTNVMTQRYAHLSEDRLRNAVRSLGDALAKKTAAVVELKQAE
jgi:integrase